MSQQVPTHRVVEPIPADAPDEREYDRDVDAALDRQLVESIEAADAAGNDYLAKLLALELGAHYYDTR